MGIFSGVGSHKELSFLVKLILYYPPYPPLASTPLPRGTPSNLSSRNFLILAPLSHHLGRLGRSWGDSGVILALLARLLELVGLQGPDFTRKLTKNAPPSAPGPCPDPQNPPPPACRAQGVWNRMQKTAEICRKQSSGGPRVESGMSTIASPLPHLGLTRGCEKG